MGLGSTAAQAHTHHWRFRSHLHHHRWSGRFFRHVASSGGLASWYGPGFSGHRTASGERFNTGAFTAAHRYWPFGTRVRVTNQSNGRSVVVRINDRGPFAAGRVIDLSKASARAIGLGGVGRVKLARL
ncbi:MAG TPA: septal ring lytic transglycosylase RlpA family protein [Lichenihabitans sp.]|jgi:rare lipoprotein A|nr:septal ring lytic transglycosylase RlpA family protein [Lichenihabitans sp.]